MEADSDRQDQNVQKILKSGSAIINSIYCEGQLWRSSFLGTPFIISVHLTILFGPVVTYLFHSLRLSIPPLSSITPGDSTRIFISQLVAP
jgi:hypothetical protein